MKAMINLRKITSLVLFFVGLLVAFTGVVLFVIPAGRVAYWNNWLLWGMSKTEYVELHTNLSFIFLFFGVIHIVYNWKVLLSYLKAVKFKKVSFPIELSLALLVTIIVTLGTYSKVFPFKNMIELGESLKVSLWGKGLEPPYGHAELSSLKVLIERMKLDPLLVEANFKKRSVQYKSPDEKFVAIAAENNLSPSELYTLMTTSVVVKKKLPESGLGKLTLNEVSQLMEIPLSDLIKRFAKAGYHPESAMTLKEIANQKGASPHDFVDLIESSGD